ncbi:MAG: type I restriction endonuclease [Cyanobacteria bacterium J06632_22]
MLPVRPTPHLRPPFGLQATQATDFFPEWTLPPLTSNAALTESEQLALDRAKANFTDMMAAPPVLENSVKLVILAPLLDLAGFYRWPYRLETEPSIEIEAEEDDVVVRGRIDVLVLKEQLWLLVIESKRSDFAVTRALPQALAYMLGSNSGQRPTYGMITNGNEFLFLKTVKTPTPEYGNSRLFSLVNPGNELHDVLQILKTMGTALT